MAAMVSPRRSVTELTKGQPQVSLPLVGAARTDLSLTEGQSADGDWILPLVKRAQERVMSQKEALLTMGMAKNQYIENLHGVGHLSIRRLGLLPEDFWRALIDELRAHYHMDNDADRLRRALDGLQASVSVIGEIAMRAVSK